MFKIYPWDEHDEANYNQWPCAISVLYKFLVILGYSFKVVMLTFESICPETNNDPKIRNKVPPRKSANANRMAFQGIF